jgi:hypothetical protein
MLTIWVESLPVNQGNWVASLDGITHQLCHVLEYICQCQPNLCLWTTIWMVFTEQPVKFRKPSNWIQPQMKFAASFCFHSFFFLSIGSCTSTKNAISSISMPIDIIVATLVHQLPKDQNRQFQTQNSNWNYFKLKLQDAMEMQTTISKIDNNFYFDNL